MKRLLTISLVLLLCASIYAVPIHSDEGTKLGAFTGPVGATNQDDNVKASLDLAHIDLDAVITYNTDVLGLLGQSTGGVFYVDSSASGTTALTWATAVNDLEEAMALCTGDAGDIILIAPNHAETIGGAKAIDLDIAGITVIGIGTGESRPTFTFDTNTDSIAIGNDDITIRNCRFIAAVTAVANAIIVEAGMDNFVIEDCVFEAAVAGTDEFIDTILISGTASDQGIIRNNLFDSGAVSNAGPKASINFVDCDYLQIYGNRFFGDHGDAAIFNETTASNFVVIRNNFIHNGIIGGTAGLDTTPGISLVATTTGIIANNVIATNVATPDLAIVAADCFLFGNTYNETEGGVSTAVDIGTKAGQTYTAIMTATSTTDDLFDVAGGPILITSFTGIVTTQIGAVTNTIQIDLDADAGFIDSDFSTAVETNGDVVGTRYLFSNATESVLTPVSDTAGNTNLMESWFCGEGMIEQTAGGATTGAIKWYMTYIPFIDGTVVTPQ